MIWTNKGLKQRIAELENELSSVKMQLKEEKFDHTYTKQLCNNQHELIVELQSRAESVPETSSNVVAPLEKEEKSSMSVGRRIAMNLRNGR